MVDFMGLPGRVRPDSRNAPGRLERVLVEVKKTRLKQGRAALAYDERLTERVLDILGEEPSLVQKKMFGGVAFMLRGNMACGVIGNDLIVRVPGSEYDAALARPHVRKMDFTGRTMRGWVVVGPEGTEDDGSLQDWVDTGASCALSLPPK